MTPEMQFDISDSPVMTDFAEPNLEAFDIIGDSEWGGIALQDNSKGNSYQIWQLRKKSTGKVMLTNESGYSDEILDNPSIVRLAMAFNANMDLLYAYTLANGETHFIWYDAATEQMRDDVFTNIRTPRMTLDDKRKFNSANADVIFAYIKDADDQIYYRLQRDRFQVEYLLGDGVEAEGIIQMGLMNNYRLGFHICLETE